MTEAFETPAGATVTSLPAPSDDASSPLRRGALEILRALREAGYDAYWAGGCVRDEVMGRAPADYDVATSATPEEVQALFERTVPVGARFGVVLVLVADHEYEVATFRAEAGYSDGRRPDEIRWATAREDVRRRDFTVNGLLLDPLAEPDHDRVVDFVGGLPDIRAEVVRAIGDPDERFDEDRLRLLRAVRFAARLGFELEGSTWRAVRRRAAQIRTVSAERIRDELERLLTEGGAAHGLTLVDEAGLTPHVLPELDVAARAARRLGDGPRAPEVAWTTLLYDRPDPGAAVEALGRRLRFSRARTRHVARALDVARRIPDWSRRRVADRKRTLREPAGETGLEAAAAAASAGELDPAELDAARHDRARWSDTDLHPPRLLDGHRLQEHGHRPGPHFKEALRAVEDAQLEGRCTTEAEALALAESILAGRDGSGGAAR